MSNDPRMDEYKCPHCGYVYQGMLLYCPNCHQKMKYAYNFKPVNNWQRAWGKEPTIDNQLQSFGCGCTTFVICVIFIIILLAAVL